MICDYDGRQCCEMECRFRGCMMPPDNHTEEETVAYDPYEYLDEMDRMSGCCGAGAIGRTCDECPGVMPNEPPDHLDTLLSARGSRYGSFEDNAQIAQHVKLELRAADGWWNLGASQAEALDMIAAKISRIVTGDPDYIDNWDDISGYAKLVADRLRRGAAGVPEGAR